MKCSNPGKQAHIPLEWPLNKAVQAPLFIGYTYAERMAYVAVMAREAFKQLGDV